MNLKEQIKNSYFEMDEDLTIGIKALVFSIFIAFNIDPSQAGLLLVFIFVDSFFGVIKSIKLKDKVSFEIFIWGITTKLAIFLIPFLVAYMALAFKHDLAWIINVFIYIIAVNELVSILGNIVSIKTGNRYSNTDFVAITINTLRSFFMNRIKVLIKAIEDKKPD
jgi:toxin secretion/phage lysis holin